MEYEKSFIKNKLNNLIKKIKEELNKLNANVIDVNGECTPVISFTPPNYSASEIGEILQMSFDIICRSGLHCAPKIHKYLKNGSMGTVRVSLSRFTKEEEVDYFIDSIKRIINE